MSGYKHSVSLIEDKCKGCTHCLKRCPTEAIRIRDSHAVINSAVCIDCGECIRVCPHNAKKATFDKLDEVMQEGQGKFLIALPPPSLYGQFAHLEDADIVLQGLIDCGFSDVFEVAHAAELVTEYTRNYMRRTDIVKPVISSACPVITRLISIRFPYLIDHVIPLLPPVEIASRMAKKEALEAHPGLKPENIKTVFISPCPAKAGYIKNALAGEGGSSIDYVVSMSEVYKMLLPAMNRHPIPSVTSKTGMIGISWASSGGESSALMNDKYLAADGVENVIRVLDDIETGNFSRLEFVELNACNGGCVGGVATVENPYIARVRLQTLRRYLPVSLNRIAREAGEEDYVPESFTTKETMEYVPAFRLDEDMDAAMQKMSAIEEICAELPALDCGFCGAPTCHAFAEDVVKGELSIDDCLVRFRELYKKEHSLKERHDDGC